MRGPRFTNSMENAGSCKRVHRRTKKWSLLGAAPFTVRYHKQIRRQYAHVAFVCGPPQFAGPVPGETRAAISKCLDCSMSMILCAATMPE